MWRPRAGVKACFVVVVPGAVDSQGVWRGGSVGGWEGGGRLGLMIRV